MEDVWGESDASSRAPTEPAIGGPGPAFSRAAAERIVADDPYGRLLIDGTGVILAANASASTMTGQGADAELLGRNIAEFIDPDHLDIAIRALAEIGDRHPTATEGIPMVFALRRPDGSPFFAEVGSESYLDVPGIAAISLRLRPYDSQRHLERFLGRLVSSTPMVELLGDLAAATDHLIQSASTAICYGWDGHHFTHVVSHRVPPVLAGAAPEHPIEPPPGALHAAPPWQVVKRTGRPLWMSLDELDDDLAAVARAEGYRSCWVRPVTSTSDDPDEDVDVDAVIIIWRTVDGPPRVGHEAGLQRTTQAAALAFARRAGHLRLLEAATVDSLTGIPNRAQFFTALESEVAVDTAPERIAVLYLDLDGFKPLNDRHGHRFGDRVLATVATEFAAQIRPGDMVARLGGDEFAVLCRDVHRIEQVTAIADRLIRAVDRPLLIEGVTVHVGLSIGIALAAPTGDSHDAVLDAADHALYQAKRSGRGRWWLAARS